MGDRFSTSMVTVAIAAAAVSTAISVLATRTSAQAPAFSHTALKLLGASLIFKGSGRKNSTRPYSVRPGTEVRNS